MGRTGSEAAVITDHVFRVYSTGSGGSITRGMCGWLGTCNKPKSEHATATRGTPGNFHTDTSDRAAILTAWDAGEPVTDIAARHHTTPGTIRRIVDQHAAGAR